MPDFISKHPGPKAAHRQRRRAFRRAFPSDKRYQCGLIAARVYHRGQRRNPLASDRRTSAYDGISRGRRGPRSDRPEVRPACPPPACYRWEIRPPPTGVPFPRLRLFARRKSSSGSRFRWVMRREPVSWFNFLMIFFRFFSEVFSELSSFEIPFLFRVGRLIDRNAEQLLSTILIPIRALSSQEHALG